MLTAREEESEGNGTEDGPGGAAAGGGATPEDADAAGAEGRHGAKKSESERVAGRRENPADESYGVGDKEGDPEDFRVVENPGGDCQGV